MNDRSDFEARIATAFAAYADRAPVEVDARSLAAVIARGSRRRGWSFPTTRASWLVVGTVLALLLMGAAIVVGAYLLRPRTTLSGGGPMIIAQADVADAKLSTPANAMHVFGFDLATGERTPIADWTIVADSSYGPAQWIKLSPDRTHALVFDVDGDLRGIVDVASHRLTPLALRAGDSTAQGDEWYAWSPTGDRIASYVSSDAWPTGSFLISDLDGHEIARLNLPLGAQVGGPSWSPSGTEIVLAGCLPCSDAVKNLVPETRGQPWASVHPADRQLHRAHAARRVERLPRGSGVVAGWLRGRVLGGSRHRDGRPDHGNAGGGHDWPRRPARLVPGWPTPRLRSAG